MTFELVAFDELSLSAYDLSQTFDCTTFASSRSSERDFDRGRSPIYISSSLLLSLLLRRYLFIYLDWIFISIDRNVTKTEHTHKLLLCFITKNEENRGATRVTRIKILSLSLSLSQTSAWSRNHIKVNIKRDSIFGFIYNETLNKWPNHWLTSIRLTRFLDRDIPRAFLFLSSSGFFFFFFFFCMMMMTMSAMSYPV